MDKEIKIDWQEIFCRPIKEVISFLKDVEKYCDSKDYFDAKLMWEKKQNIIIHCKTTKEVSDKDIVCRKNSKFYPVLLDFKKNEYWTFSNVFYEQVKDVNDPIEFINTIPNCKGNDIFKLCMTRTLTKKEVDFYISKLKEYPTHFTYNKVYLLRDKGKPQKSVKEISKNVFKDAKEYHLKNKKTTSSLSMLNASGFCQMTYADDDENFRIMKENNSKKANNINAGEILSSLPENDLLITPWLTKNTVVPTVGKKVGGKFNKSTVPIELLFTLRNHLVENKVNNIWAHGIHLNYAKLKPFKLLKNQKLNINTKLFVPLVSKKTTDKLARKLSKQEFLEFLYLTFSSAYYFNKGLFEEGATDQSDLMRKQFGIKEPKVKKVKIESSRYNLDQHLSKNEIDLMNSPSMDAVSMANKTGDKFLPTRKILNKYQIGTSLLLSSSLDGNKTTFKELLENPPKKEPDDPILDNNIKQRVEIRMKEEKAFKPSKKSLNERSSLASRRAQLKKDLKVDEYVSYLERRSVSMDKQEIALSNKPKKEFVPAPPKQYSERIVNRLNKGGKGKERFTGISPNRRHLNATNEYWGTKRSRNVHSYQVFDTEEEADAFIAFIKKDTSDKFIKVLLKDKPKVKIGDVFYVKYNNVRNKHYKAKIKREKKSMNYVGVTEPVAKTKVPRNYARKTLDKKLVSITKDYVTVYRITELEARKFIVDHKDFKYVDKTTYKLAKNFGHVKYNLSDFYDTSDEANLKRFVYHQVELKAKDLKSKEIKENRHKRKLDKLNKGRRANLGRNHKYNGNFTLSRQNTKKHIKIGKKHTCIEAKYLQTKVNKEAETMKVLFELGRPSRRRPRNHFRANVASAEIKMHYKIAKAEKHQAKLEKMRSFKKKAKVINLNTKTASAA